MIVLTLTSDPVDSVAFAPVGSLLAIGQGYRWLTVWDTSTRQIVGGQRRSGFYTRSEFRFHPLLPHIYQLNDFNEVELIDPVARDSYTLAQQTGWAENVLLTSDAKQLLVCERGSCEFRLFDFTNAKFGKLMWTVPVYARNVWGVRVAIELLPDDSGFIVAENHSNSRTRLAVRSMENGELLAATRFPNRELGALALSPDRTSAVVTSDMSLFVYDPNNLKSRPQQVKNDNRKHFTGIAFHPSGRYLGATSNDQTAKLYDTTNWQVVKSYTWGIGRMRSIAFSPDGTLAAAGSDTGKVVVWDVDL
jgi:WD40 repeat protein